MKRFKRKTMCVLVSGAMATACGGGGGGGGLSLGGGSDIGIGGTGAVSSGTIDGFGSIFVNGIRYNTDEAEISVGGMPAAESDLALGMVVTITGFIDDDGLNGTARRVVFDRELQGPVAAVALTPDGDAALLTVLGREVIVERAGTVLDDLDFDGLAVGQLIEVSGFVNEDGQLRATRLELQADTAPAGSEVEITGEVAMLNGTRFSLDELIVDFSGADLSDLPGATLVNGQIVEVQGTLAGNVITAARIDDEDELVDDLEDDINVTVQGAVNTFRGLASFIVDGVLVDATAARLIPAQLSLADGVVVQVEGSWDGNVLQASEVRARRGRIEIAAPVVGLDVENSALTLGLAPGPVTLRLDAFTRLDDDTGRSDDLRLEDLVIGDFLEVEAVQLGAELLAVSIDRDDPDEHVLQGPVDSFVVGQSITVLGITYGTVGAEFEDTDDNDVSSSFFFSQLAAGDFVKLEDELTADGVADEVEFEREDALDGDFEFDDDCDDDDDDAEFSDGICGPLQDDDDDDPDDDDDDDDDDDPDDDDDDDPDDDDDEDPDDEDPDDDDDEDPDYNDDEDPDDEDPDDNDKV